ncbi:hypothetical protein BpHYR1_018525 [Brachionus plicatilis]|uniref:Uncharacterized protein n=1 Tax=Brachionus plicatilis TaxID=10195 RepID=A0A3M7RSN8_BRAPC|nr:hypothetical protein BpHYR1_018525 [Brachionus plicatilis]
MAYAHDGLVTDNKSKISSVRQCVFSSSHRANIVISRGLSFLIDLTSCSFDFDPNPLTKFLSVLIVSSGPPRSFDLAVEFKSIFLLPIQSATQVVRMILIFYVSKKITEIFFIIDKKNVREILHKINESPLGVSQDNNKQKFLKQNLSTLLINQEHQFTFSQKNKFNLLNKLLALELLYCLLTRLKAA